jgi:hypothetical protein
MEKIYNEQSGVGKSKYVVNYNDGVKKHKDGSLFFDIAIFKNLSDKKKFISDLKHKGYKYKYAKGGGLTGNQSKLDLNKNGKLDSNDFKMLRSKKGNGGGTGVSSETGYAEGTNASLLMNQDYLAYKKGGGVGDKKFSDYHLRQQNLMFEVIEWCSENNMVIGSPSYMDKIEKVATTGDSNETNDIFNNMLDTLNKGNMVIKSPTFMKKLEEAKKYSNGGSLADTPESFPSTDAMSYAEGGSTSGWCYSIGGL